MAPARARARTLWWGLATLGGSLLLSLLLWGLLDQPFFLLFLFLPFLWFRRRAAPQHDPEPAPRTCPRCGRRSTDANDQYCPRDGTPLQEPSRSIVDKP